MANIGETVYFKNYELSDKAQHKAAKLLPKYKDPFTVARIVSPVIVDLRDGKEKYTRHIHMSQLKKCGKNINKRITNQVKAPIL